MNNVKIWRIGGIALVAGLALFLVSLLLKLLLVATATFVLVRVVGVRLASHFFGQLGPQGLPSTGIISIDNPAYRPAVNQRSFERIISIS